jgi:hypothetical protein
MAGYLENYGAGEAKREGLLKWGILSAIGVLVLSVVLFYSFRHFRERQVLDTFLDDLRKKDYKAAYATWGCTESNPCRYFAYDKFLEDFGPQGRYKDASSPKMTQKWSCVGGIIRVIEFGAGNDVDLLIDYDKRLVSYAPPRNMWRGCTILP